MDEPQALAAFAALAQEHRLRLVRSLVTAGPDGMASGVLAEILETRFKDEVGVGTVAAGVASPVAGAEPRFRRQLELVVALDELSRAYLAWTGDHEIVPTIDHDITGLHAARLRLVDGVTTVLARGLRLLGAPAPERM